ncbi:MAG: chemotaxis protein CheA [Gammaproteobacteria bacterium]|nr:chemotaxis protein CheA [Gammaproteobacteria bacterium]
MSFDADEEILQDFLIEAGEILEQLNEQLVELEQSPDDADLLNAVFRGFHTIKGGASFLSLTPLVEICHRAEDVFNLLRNGELQVTSQIMDIMLPVLDSLNDMFDTVRGGQMPDNADPQQLKSLEAILSGESLQVAPAAPVAPEPVPPEADVIPEPVAEAPATVEPPTVSDEPAPATTESRGEPLLAGDEGGDITDDEFETLLGALDAPAGQVDEPATPVTETEAPTSAPGSDEITEDEFEALLDQLHGSGAAPGSGEERTETSTTDTAPEEPVVQAEAPTPAPGSDEITEDEFEALLDQLHGSGSAPGQQVADEPELSAATPAEQEPAKPAEPQAPSPAPVAENKPAPKKATAKPKQEAAGETTVRVDTKRLDDIMNMVGELVLVRNRLVNLESSLENDEVSKAVSNLDVVTADLQTSVMKTRMQPIKKVFGRFPRVVRDLARSLNKEVSLEMFGEDTDLDKNLVEALADPLVHLVRNAVDHGIEMPDIRAAAGKPRQGTVVLSAEQEGDHILLSITDDGGGMDPDKLRKLAVEKGLMDNEHAARMDDKECFNLIFAPGFSTKAEISDISGRGVGMDVVKTRIIQLNGSIDIDSALGEGTRLTIKVPLTLAIIPTLMVMLGEQIFALPLVNVNEIFNLDLSHTNIIDGQLVVMVRDAPMPLFYLNKWLLKENPILSQIPEVSEGDNEESHVVVVHVGTQKIGFVVDQLIGQEEVVIKPLGALLHNVQGLAGATITGDGKISLILDVPSLLKKYARKMHR